MSADLAPVRDLFLARRGIACISPVAGDVPSADDLVRAVELELAALGYVVAARLRAALQHYSLAELAEFRAWTTAALAAHRGANQKHEPLFRQFPDGVPSDTRELWWTKVLVHFMQNEGRPCLFCRRIGTTHVLNPCRHVVCDHCFDGSNYSACPVCEHHVDRTSPFFRPTPARDGVPQSATFHLLDLGGALDVEAQAYFVALCARKQALSPDDRHALITLLTAYRAQILAWLPTAIPLRENIAVIFGTLFQLCDPALVLPHAQRFMKTATDILRFIAVLSGTDGSLQRQPSTRLFARGKPLRRFTGKTAALIAAPPPQWGDRANAWVPLNIARFKTAKLPRPLRRALFTLMEAMPADRVAEDMLRHRPLWVWVGEFLHPHEYAKRYPNVARAFQIVRKKSPTHAPAPAFRTWASRVDAALSTLDLNELLPTLSERPGELARRLDHLVRATRTDAAREQVIRTFEAKLSAMATPVLVMLHSHLPTRIRKARVRMFWPKGRNARGASSSDKRPLLAPRTTGRLVRAIEDELLSRFAQKPHFATCVIDEALNDIMVPFNERTASSSAVSLPRGSRVPVPTGKLLRMFLHWCQPENDRDASDLDLSVAFYDREWQFVGTCSYYELQFKIGDALVAQSAGDLQNAPWPDGASEFVDVHIEPARAADVRYAVMVVNNYNGKPFSKLARGFAGLMTRDSATGAHFDPRTVELKFALDGENGVFMPLVLDLEHQLLHWLDVQSTGELAFNNVASSQSSIRKVCPEMITYFESGCRPSLWKLGTLHAAARCERVIMRPSNVQFTRRASEATSAFYARLHSDDHDGSAEPVGGAPIFALLVRGNLDVPDASSTYALFRERVTPTLAASDLLS